MFKVIVRTIVNPSEDEDKVKKAVSNVFTPESMEVIDRGEYKEIVAVSESYESLEKLHKLLRKYRILDAARKHLKAGRGEREIEFELNKQVAYVGKISFCTTPEESPLGSIKFRIETENPKVVIDWLAPRTVRGKPVREIEDLEEELSKQGEQA